MIDPTLQVKRLDSHAGEVSDLKSTDPGTGGMGSSGR